MACSTAGHPIVVGGHPIVVGGHPIVPGGHPIGAGGHPIVPGGHPIVPGGHPIVPGGHPIVPGGHPIVSPAVIVARRARSSPAVIRSSPGHRSSPAVIRIVAGGHLIVAGGHRSSPSVGSPPADRRRRSFRVAVGDNDFLILGRDVEGTAERRLASPRQRPSPLFH